MLDTVNAIIYAMEGDIDMAIISMLCTIPIVGSLIGLPIKYAMKYGADIGMAFMKFGIKNAPEITQGVSRLAKTLKSKYDDAAEWLGKKFAKFMPDGGMVAKRAKSTKDIYRAVSPEELDDIISTREFRGIKGTFAAKQFANNFDETLNWANMSINYDKAAIVKVTIPEDIYNKLNHMELDSHEFPSGTITVEPEMLEIFNDSILDIEHVF